jgi:type II secretory pathway pseudopilin PulG
LKIARNVFTLIELVALLAIMLLVTGVVVSNVGRIPTFLSLETTVQKIQYLFSKASMMAMAQGKTVTVAYEPGQKSFSISSPGSSADGEFSGKFLSENVPGAVSVEFDSESPSYVFFPDGTGSGTPFSLSLKGHSFRIRISGLTGLAIVEKLNEGRK